MKFVCKFNRDLYMKILNLRTPKGSKLLTEHPLVGRKIKDLSENRILTIDKVVKNWYHGYYLTIHPIDENNSHATLFWENISSVDKIIFEGIEEAHKTWELL